MNGAMFRLLAVGVAFVVMVSAVSSWSARVAAAEAAAGRQIDRTLPAGWTKEECVDVSAGVRLDYSFRSTGVVSFNIHHHVGRETTYDVERHKTLESDASLVAPVDARYCLTFTNEETREIQIEGRYAASTP